MRGAPQSGFSRLIFRINSRISCEMLGRPGRPWRTFQVQSRRKAVRCQAMTVSGLTMTSAERQAAHTSDRPAQKSRSNAVSLGRFTERCRTPS
jgi:hypothetical protein